jgi:GNAT superfamily N-acetyltransferase
LLPRPRRPAAKLAANPASTVRVFRPAGCKAASLDDPARESIRRSPDIVVRRVDAGETSLIESLSDLLIDAVQSGASVGFLAPVARATADRYWRDVVVSLDAADGLRLWVAERDGKVVGSAQLALCHEENGRHRAEVQKLFVHTAARGQGLATLLLRAVEAEAREQQRSLLVLDTLLASHAENVYRHLGWSRAGEIPGYATTPEGELCPTVYYFKQLGA